MGDAAEITASEKTGEFYRVDFFKERAEIAMELAKVNHAKTLNGNRLIPREAFSKDNKEFKDVLGGDEKFGFARQPSKLDHGYKLEIVQNGVAIPDMEIDRAAPQFINKDDINQWAIRITAPANLSRDQLAPAFAESFSKELTGKNFERTDGGMDKGVPVHKITLNIGTLMNARDLKLLTRNGNTLLLTIEQSAALDKTMAEEMAEAAAEMNARKRLGGGLGGDSSNVGRGGR